MAAFIILICNDPSYAKSKKSYWDFFKEKRKTGTGYKREISATFDVLLPFGKIRDYVKGGGPTLGYRHKNRKLIYGLDLGFWYFPGKNFNNDKVDDVTEYFIMIPLTFSIGYRFNAASNLNITPKIYTGPSTNLLSYAKGGIPVTGLGGRDYDFIWGIHQFSGGGIELSYKITGRYHLQFNCLYGLLAEYGGNTTLIHMLRLNIGGAYRF